MKITQDISDDATGLKREVEYLSLFNNAKEDFWELQMKVNFYSINGEEKKYLPTSKSVQPFKTTNDRRVFINEDNTLNNITDSQDERWENAIPETIFWDNLLISSSLDRSLVLKQFILDLDKDKWKWFD